MTELGAVERLISEHIVHHGYEHTHRNTIAKACEHDVADAREAEENARLREEVMLQRQAAAFIREVADARHEARLAEEHAQQVANLREERDEYYVRLGKAEMETHRLRGADVEAGLAQVALKEVQAQLATAAEVIAQLVEALEEALSLFAYVGSCTFECEHRFCKEKRAERDYGLEQLAAARAWQEREHSKEAPCSSSSSP